MNTIDMLCFLLEDKKYTKWRIKKELNVSWRTVRIWQLGYSVPTPANRKKLEELCLLASQEAQG